MGHQGDSRSAAEKLRDIPQVNTKERGGGHLWLMDPQESVLGAECSHFARLPHLSHFS